MKFSRSSLLAVCAIGLPILSHTALTQEPTEVDFVGNFKDWASTVAAPQVGSIKGMNDLEVRHPMWITARQADAPPRDPSDPVNIAEAWVTQTFTNLRDRAGTVVPGATLVQEWVGVSVEQAVQLGQDGLAVLGSSGGFLFGLQRQTASPAATAAFGLKTIDNGEFIHATNTLQGICG